MVCNDFLDTMKGFTEEAVSECILPVRLQSARDVQEHRAAGVYKMRLPDSHSATKVVPYILLQIITTEDSQKSGKTESLITLRAVFCVYSDDEQEGSLMLVELIDRLRTKMLSCRVLNNRYALDISSIPLQGFIYPDDTAPYFAGELTSGWRMPATEREVSNWLR